MHASSIHLPKYNECEERNLGGPCYLQRMGTDRSFEESCWSWSFGGFAFAKPWYAGSVHREWSLNSGSAWVFRPDFDRIWWISGIIRLIANTGKSKVTFQLKVSTAASRANLECQRCRACSLKHATPLVAMAVAPSAFVPTTKVVLVTVVPVTWGRFR